MADRRAAHKAPPDMREKKQVTVRMTEEFARDLNLIFLTYGITDATYVVRESVAAQADAIRDRIAARQASGRPPYSAVQHSPGKAVLCTQCQADGFVVCQEV